MLSNAQVWPFYPADKQGGAVTGAVRFRDLPGSSDFDGAGLPWFRASDRGDLYPGGWPQGIRTNLVGGRYRRPVEAPVFDGLTPSDSDGNAAITWTGAGLPGGVLVQALNLDADNHPLMLAPNPAALALKIDTKTGLFRGKFTHPATHHASKVRGAMLQKQNLGAGAFRTDTEIGGVSIESK